MAKGHHIGETDMQTSPSAASIQLHNLESITGNNEAEPQTLEKSGPPEGTGGESAEVLATVESVDESDYLKGFTLGLLMFGLCLVTFVVALDNTIIATAIPRITTEFSSLNDVGWYGSAYLLTTTALQPTFGKFYTFFSVKWIYLVAIVIFEVGSVLCAASLNSMMFIIGRAVAGIGGAALFSGGLTILGLVVPLRKRALYSGILTSMFGISAVVGPLLGGAFTDRLTWRWCFWINLPFGGMAFVAVLLIFKMPKRENTNLTFVEKMFEVDLLGAFLLIPGIVCLLLALQWGGTQYPWGDSRVWGCLLGFALIIAVFIAVQIYRGESATIPPQIFKQRTVFTSCLFMCLFTMGIYTHFYYLPFYFQAAQGTTAQESGIRTVPYIISLTVFSVITGATINLVGWYVPFLLSGCAVFTIGAGLLFTLQVDSSEGRWIGYQVLAGVGAGIALQTPFIAVQTVLSVRDMPTGNALTGFFNSCGAAISISVAQNIFSNTLLQQLVTTVPEINPQVVINAGATHVADVTPPTLLAKVVQAYDVAVTRAFAMAIVTGGLSFLVGLGVEWKSVKGKKIQPGIA